MARYRERPVLVQHREHGVDLATLDSPARSTTKRSVRQAASHNTFAFLARVAAWVSALTAHRSLRDSQRPNMATQLVAPAGQPLQLPVRNFGAGPAKNVGFYAVVGREEATASLSMHRFRAPGQTSAIAIPFDPEADLEATKFVVICLDRENDIFAWSRDGRQKVYKRRRWTKERSIRWHFERFYPGEIPESELQPVGHSVLRSPE